MKVEWSDSFTREYNTLPSEWQERFDEKFTLFVHNPRHPSLQVKKMSGTDKIWEVRVSQNYRWTFELIKDGVRLRHIGTHDILRRE